MKWLWMISWEDLRSGGVSWSVTRNSPKIAINSRYTLPSSQSSRKENGVAFWYCRESNIFWALIPATWIEALAKRARAKRSVCVHVLYRYKNLTIFTSSKSIRRNNTGFFSSISAAATRTDRNKNWAENSDDGFVDSKHCLTSCPGIIVAYI